MKKITAAALALGLAAGIGFALSQDGMPPMPKPGPEHALLKQFVGQWDCDVEMCMEAGKPSVKSKASETTTMLGEFWLLVDVKGEFFGAPFLGHGQMTFDTDKKKYMMTWIDSMGPMLLTSWGTADATGKIFTMETEMVCEGVKTQMKDVFSVTGADTRTMVSMHKNGDAPWREAMKISYKRKK